LLLQNADHTADKLAGIVEALPGKVFTKRSNHAGMFGPLNVYLDLRNWVFYHEGTKFFSIKNLRVFVPLCLCGEVS